MDPKEGVGLLNEWVKEHKDHYVYCVDMDWKREKYRVYLKADRGCCRSDPLDVAIGVGNPFEVAAERAVAAARKKWGHTFTISDIPTPTTPFADRLRKWLDDGGAKVIEELAGILVRDTKQ